MFSTLANKITLVRILNVPVFIVLMLYYRNSLAAGGPPQEEFRYLAIAFFLFTLSLDAIDGHLARMRREITKIGAVLDPLADKTLLISAFVLLSGGPHYAEPHLPVWFVVLVIGRDVVLVVGSLVVNFVKGRVDVKPRVLGKATTFFQTAVVALALFRVDGYPLYTGIGLAAACTFLSGVQYVMDGMRQMERADLPVRRDA